MDGGLIRPGLTAAWHQLISVVLITIIGFVSIRTQVFTWGVQGSGLVDSCQKFPIAQLTKMYMLTALLVALCNSKHIETTAKRIRQASRVIHPREPELATIKLIVQLTLAAIGFAVISFHRPPEIIFRIATDMNCENFASLMWAGLLSIGTASFGATAHAAIKARAY